MRDKDKSPAAVLKDVVNRRLAEGSPLVTEVRPLYDVANEVRRLWKKPYFGAVPYLSAMGSLTDVRDNYGADSGTSVVLYFLANATTWRGDDARRVKAELKRMVA